MGFRQRWLFGPFLAAVAAAQEVAVDFTIVPQTVVEATVDTESELGPCTCDLTANLCDTHCCCDADCPAGAFEWCLPDGPVASGSEVPECIDDRELARFNPSESKGLITVDSAIRGQLCVVIDNNPSLGKYLPEPPAFTVGQAISEAAPFPASYASFTRTTLSGGYSPDDPVATLSLSGTPTHLRRPSAGSGTSCVEGTPVAFLVDAEGPPCTFPAMGAGEMEAFCKGESTVPFHARFARTAGVSAVSVSRNAGGWSSNAATDYVKATVSSVSVVVGGVVASTVTEASAISAYVTTWDADNSVCRNTVTKAAVRISEDGTGVVTAVTVAVTVQDIAAGNPVPMDVSVSFSKSGLEAATLPRSGNPGYISGLPLLGGNIENDPAGTGKKAVVRNVLGLILPTMANANGRCARPTTASVASGVTLAESESAKILPVATANANEVSSCYVEMTADQLRDFCNSQGDAPPGPLALPYTAIGRFGNANQNLAGEWLEIEIEDWRTATNYVASTGTCQSIPAALHLEIVTADYGSVLNPQRRVVGARGRYTTEDWVAPRNSGGIGKYTYTTTVTFANLAATDLVEIMPAAPAAFFSVPKDTLYPFNLNSGNKRFASAWWAAIGVFLAVAVVTGWW